MHGLVAGTILCLATGIAPLAQAAGIETVLHSFAGYYQDDGYQPITGVVMDYAGNLYGTSYDAGNPAFFGNVFQLTPPAAGQKAWASNVIYTFANAADGNFPWGQLAVDSQGRLYGTTNYGGSSDSGTVFMLTPPAPGQSTWTKTTVWSFSGPGGTNPTTGVILDPAGNLYGTAFSGGPSDGGTAYKLTPPAVGQTGWTQQVLFAFDSAANGAFGPDAPLLAGSQGALYGTTIGGGKGDFGTVFKLTPPKAGQTAWTEKVIYTFKNGADGNYPSRGGLVSDRSGTLYGMTAQGGAAQAGTVFKLSPPAAGGPWAYTLLRAFDPAVDGFQPYAGLYIDKATNLFGTLPYSGPYNHGSVFELTPPAAGQTAWTETVFGFPNADDGYFPESTLIRGKGNALIGTTRYGGSFGEGTTFEIHP